MTAVARDLHAEAASRLGRELSAGELLVDLAAYDDALETGKAELAAAIEEEKRRAIRAVVRGRGDPVLRITPRMVAVLRKLYRAGRDTGRAEIRAVTAELDLADEEDDPDAELPPALDDLQYLLRSRLNYVTIRVQDGAIDAGLGQVAAAAVVRALERRVPGVKAAAADLVSPAFLAGLGDSFDTVSPALGLRWRYSAIGDRATCPVCRRLDGTAYDSWELIQQVLPSGGPNPLCYGSTRCRCRPVMEPPESLRGRSRRRRRRG